MNLNKLPKIGARNFKTALSILLSIIILKILGFESSFYACIAAVICLTDSYENSIKTGKNRMIGTIIGGSFGMIATIILSVYNTFWLRTLLIFLFTIAVIYICTILKKPGSVSIACIVLLANLLLNRDYSNYIYTFSRIIETFIGVVIAVFVNAYILPPNRKNKTS
ncbi:MAG: FUSC family protein [Sarcina sp.]